MAIDYRTEWEPVKLVSGQFADFFMERSVPHGEDGFDEFAVLSFVPRTDADETRINLPVDQLRRLVTFLDSYCREMEGKPPAP